MPRTSLTEANITDLRTSIELAADCTVTLQEDRDSWSGEFLGYYAWANRDSEHRPGTRTVANAWSETPIDCLDKLAAALRVKPAGFVGTVPVSFEERAA